MKTDRGMDDKTENVGLEKELCCVVEKCRYPETCKWNQRCMESEMKKSMDAKMESGMAKPMMDSKKEEVNLVDLGFMDARIKTIDIAAFLDRVQRGGQEGDYRVVELKKALRHLLEEEGDRTKRVLLTLSDPSEEPIPEAHGKGAAGAWSGSND